MKKSLITLSLAALFGASSLYAADNDRSVVTDNNSYAVTESNRSICEDWRGRIGGFSASMYICDGIGKVFIDGNGERTIRMKSLKGNRLALNAFQNGKYIGYYSGILHRYNNYSGTFYNKNGKKVTFDMYVFVD